MGEMFRGREMSLGQIIVPTTICIETAERLGRLGLIQFYDLNDNTLSFDRRFVNEIKRCEEIERILRVFEETLHFEEDRPGFNKLFKRTKLLEEKSLFIGQQENETLSSEQLVLELTRQENELKQMTSDVATAERAIDTVKESIKVTEVIGDMLGEMKDLMIADTLKYVVGVCDANRWETLRLLIWRVSRGFAIVRSTGLDTGRTVFAIFVQGDEVLAKLHMVCSMATVRMFDKIPIETSERTQFFIEREKELSEMSDIFTGALETKRQCLKIIADNINMWKSTIARERDVYFTLNMFHVDAGHSHLCGEGWFPTDQFSTITSALEEVSGPIKPLFGVIQPGPGIVPPTFIETSQYSQSAQDLCESYSIPKYGEVNPGFLYLVTFPWLFGIMFGDVGHGIIVTLFALALIVFQRKLKSMELNEIVLMLFDARWMLLAMGMFSIYVGLLYNECFGIAFDIFGTAWDKQGEQYYEKSSSGYVYPFGVDPIWKSSNNELYFYNSLKMKLAILVGVVQMTVGIWISLINHIHFKNLLDVVFRFMPEITFMTCTFGYLCFLILVKWIHFIPNAPMITNVFLEMFQNYGVVTPPNRMYAGQSGIQPILFVLTVISVLLMLIPKPIIVILLKRKDRMRVENGENKDDYYQEFKPENNDFIVENAFDKPEDIPYLEKTQNFEMDNQIEQSALLSDQKLNDMNKVNDDFFEPKAPRIQSSRLKDVWFRKDATYHFDEKEWIRVKDDPDDEEGNTILEIFIFNTIHAIEFVLGCISNTASYLRLWALSLAHAQLSAVFLEYVFYLLLGLNNCITTFFGFAVFAMITLGILIGMESLSAFLHTLRLHWVEFQNKFYLGDGVRFVPFAFKPTH
ncbi:vacuolar proton ATPase, putative [Entamoeba invadens IP1]|uniref:vacuolar proton ATPase, putative n=1 Tax=Entamoeba invadens IP1 TaxID=370355 RepID=UPI0002C3D1D6|nr:vacuolar proton ATPase, putative [Entamoeba invadens IP1]ELP93901.1 vacuolar proton ATPase, putative [Entamoeba invadens IP1]|eukprot:XP_004260672.1 vacuolar proton ATPase, putative [Entamoeba invadens IP1]